jgi:hypothetical protein
VNDSAPYAAAGRRGAREAVLGILIASFGCARDSPAPPGDPVFRVSISITDPVRQVLALEIENLSTRPLHFSDPDRWNFANLIKVGFRGYQSVISVEAPRAVSDRQPDRDGDMLKVHWVLPIEDGREIAARSRERWTVRVPEAVGGGRYSLALVVVARAQERWLTVEEPVLGRRTADLPGPARWLAFVIFGCLLLASGALISLALPRRRSGT